MKGMFRRNGAASNASSASSASAASGDAGRARSSSGAGGLAGRLAAVLGQQYTVPAFPHPLPDRYLVVRYTPTGVLILPVSQPRHTGSKTDTLPRTSEDQCEQDVAFDSTLAELNAKQSTAALAEAASLSGSGGGGGGGGGGARLGWGRDGSVQASTAQDASQPHTLSLDSESPAVHCYGVVGVLRVFRGAYLLVITSRTFVGDYLHGRRPIYRCTGVLAIPLSEDGAKATLQKEAKRQFDAYQSLAQVRDKGTVDSDDEDDDDDDNDEVETPSVIPREGFGALQAASIGRGSAAATLKPNKSSPWLTRKVRPVSEADESAPLEQHPSDAAHEPQVNNTSVDAPAKTDEETDQLTDSKVEPSADELWHEATKAELEEKVVKETARQYSRGEMWFTYDFDLTTPLQQKQTQLDEMNKTAAASASGKKGTKQSTALPGRSGNMDPVREPWSTLPLWRRADRRFWHNEHLASDFVEEGLHGLVLPLMQGFVQITHLPLDMPSPPTRTFDLSGDAMDAVSEVVSSARLQAQILVISRRSKERAGLRYQRRGVNTQGQVANYVETEQILLVRRGEDECHVMSFVQFRGSIPLYWKQDPFSMKPPPVLEGSAEDNRKAVAKHFDFQAKRYGRVICVNLAEQHGKEGAITKAYGDAIEQLNRPDAVVYKPFDFHEECKGMRFERVGKLIDELKDTELAQMDCYWKTVRASEGETVYSRQTSAFRVSCLDCLDRTNVVQSSFARYMLKVQLQRVGVQTTGDEAAFDFAFNDSWANNGDMVSQIYAGTRALKGDFTRTGKRNLMGMMNDATNSVYRMVQGAVTDFFKQTVVDFQYGYASLATLERYNDNLAAPDPSQTNRLARARAHAIETSSRELIHTAEETLLTAWTLFSPIEASRIQSPKLEEKVVLLTNKALYSCGYDYTADKVAEFSKVKLGDIVSIQRGMYILSPNEGYHPENHWGLVVSYVNEERRLNTASMRSKPAGADASAVSPGAVNFVAFRAVVDDASIATLQGLDGTVKGSSPFVSMLKARAKHGRRSSISGGGGGAASAALAALTSHDVVDTMVSVLVERCAAAGACDADDLSDFVKEETIQSLAQAKANASLFAPLIEGLKRRVWL